jgi:uncharacterized protein YlxP (DUF503 family)
MRARLTFMVAMLVLAGCCASLPASALGADSLYWTSRVADKLSVASTDGSGGHDLALAGGATVISPEGLAIDPVAGRIYWTHSDGISVANLDGSDAHDLALSGPATVDSLDAVAVDPVARRIYWTSIGRTVSVDKISVANLDGSDAHDLQISGAATVRVVAALAVDPVGGHIYWANFGAARISVAKLDGSDAHDLTIAGSATLHQPLALAVDPVGGRIYWTDTGAIAVANLDGGDAHDLTITGTATVSKPLGLTVDPAGGRIYWSSLANKISVATLDGGDAHDLATGNATVDRVDYLVMLASPRPAGPPAVTGGSSPGAALSCSQGAWAPDVVSSFFYAAPTGFAYQWTRDGTDVPGATQTTLTAGTPGDYRCRVTAQNHGGASSQTSDAHAVRDTVTVRDTVAPVLSGVSLTHARFRVGRAATAIAARAKPPARGTVLRFASSEAGKLSILVERVRPGQQVELHGKRVCKAVRRAVRRGRCTAYAKAATLTRAIRAGRGSVALSGRIGRRPLAPGGYRLTITVRDAAGNVAKATRRTFSILPG